MSFGKDSGPQQPKTASAPFPPFSGSAPARSSRAPEIGDRMRSSPLAFGTSGSPVRPYQPGGVQRRREASQRLQSPPLAFQSAHPAGSPSYPSAGVQRPIVSPPRWGDGQRSFFRDNDAQTHPQPSAVTSFVASRNSGTSIAAKIPRSQDLQRTTSPTSLSTNENVSRNSNQSVFQSGRSDSLVDNRNLLVPPRTRSPRSAFENNHYVEDFRPPFSEAQPPALSSPAWDNLDRGKFPGNYPNLLGHQDQSSVSPYVVSYDSGRSFMNHVADVHAPKRTRSPPMPFSNEVFQQNPQFAQNDSERPSISPPRLGTRSDTIFSSPDSQIPRRSSPTANNIVANASRPTSSQVPKRTRSPPPVSADEVFQGNSYSMQDGTEREMQAKAKRLARFKTELSETAQKPDIADQKVFANRREQSLVQRQKFVGELSMELTGDLSSGNALPDYEGLESSSIIIGLCPDMCPESERAERERKGDLDQYERLDGDRNQTSKFLAIKKYNRTAEREAYLIRPMPILQKTIDYLLSLLDQPYDDRFLGMYNFLWDRMRAIRMDLRMQHIFNQGSITMLEQMIRLHIIAMHELCEYTKGEGFSEGFDAHLNIEQMNKTSVELFQMYDDHRKKGINVPTEKEFRGYYALLKLDKHPGYKVEPAELSLDLAKMTPEIRQAPEVLFARDVARACRVGNFIAFFRLARKASYLQACLMHAHFSKLRTQALASLHSGLQNNQGIPVAHVARWLGLEEEDIESLLEYHGFLLKEFEEPYMVKEGPFLNGDKDYPTKCSNLVHLKKSRTIVENVSASCQEVSLPTEATKEIQLDTIYQTETKAIPSVERESSAHVVDEEMTDFQAVPSPKYGTKVQSIIETSIVDQQIKDDHWVAGASLSPRSFSFAHSSPISQSAKVGMLEKPNNDALFGISPERKSFGMEARPLQIVAGTQMQERSPSGKYDLAVESSVPQSVVIANMEDEEPPDTLEEKENDEVMANYQDEEVAKAALKLILRLWRRRSSKQRELRERRQLAAVAALNSLSLGPPIRQNKDQPSTLDEFDIDHIMRKRYDRHKRSWLRLNVSDVIADVLWRRNPDAKCLCWKIVLCSQMDNSEGDKLMQRSQVAHLGAGPWLFSKLMPSGKDDDNGLVVSSPGLSIWKKWVPSQSGTDLACCLSVVKRAEFDNLNETVSGASAVLFLVSESIPWKLQKIQLHNLLMSIPSGSCLPLLILSGSYNEEVSDPASIITNELGLNDIDKSRISCFMVVFLVGIQQKEQSDGYFSDEQLRQGLQWLASESPLQPLLHCVKTRELVLTHLSVSLEVLDKTSEYEVCPNHCISAFNEALDQSLGEIAAAAKASPANWPCPEIALLEDSSDEHLVVNWYLPSIGWSSVARIESLVCAIRACKLPSFPEDISLLKTGSTVGKEIENLRLQLENWLIRYLTQSSEMMGVPLATKEACVMLQRGTRLELHNFSYYIVPKWVMIFRRIFNWRLMSLSSGAFSSAYILERHHVAPTSGNLDKLWLEGSVSSYYCSSHPSLDEIIEVGCSPIVSVSGQLQPEGFQPPSVAVSNGEVQVAANTSDLVEDERNSAQNGKLAVTSDAAYITSGLYKASELVVSGRVTKEAENNLSKLLEHCNIVQNRNHDKLSIYF